MLWCSAIRTHSFQTTPTFLKLASSSTPNTSFEQYYTSIQLDTMDTRLKTLEAKMGNKAILLRGLPATGFTKNNLDWNLKYLCEKAEISFDQVSSSSNYIINSDSSILRLEDSTRRSSKWRLKQMSTPVTDLPGNHSTFMEIFRKILPPEEQGPRGQLQSDLSTLQIWPSIEAPTVSLLAQVSYTLDLRFPRRYVCVIFISTQYLEEVQSH